MMLTEECVDHDINFEFLKPVYESRHEADKPLREWTGFIVGPNPSQAYDDFLQSNFVN